VNGLAVAEDPKPPANPPGRPRTRLEPWSDLGLEMPARLHDAICKAADRQGESIAEWMRGAAIARLRREGQAVRPPDDPDNGDGGPLVVG
jgi:hypothetical protein